MLHIIIAAFLHGWELQCCHWHAAEAEPSLQGVAEGVDASERRRRPGHSKHVHPRENAACLPHDWYIFAAALLLSVLLLFN